MDKFAFVPVVPFVMGAAALLFACSGGVSADVAADDGAAFGDATAVGKCVPTSSVRYRTMSGEGCTSTYGGQAKIAQGSITLPILGKLAIDVGGSGVLASAGGTATGATPNLNVNAAITGTGGLVSAVGANGVAAAESSFKNLNLSVAGLGITATSIGSQAIAMCGAAPTATTTLAGLKIGGQSITVTGQANQTIVSGLVTIVINEQIATPNGIQVNALHVSALNLIDVTLGDAVASIVCSCPSDGGVGVGVGVSSSSGGVTIGVDAGVTINDGGVGVGVGVGVGIDAGNDAGVSVGVGVGVGASSGGITVDAGVGVGVSSSSGGIVVDAGVGVGVGTGSSSGETTSSSSSSGGDIATQPASSSGNTDANAGLDANAQNGTGTLGSACDTKNPCAAGYSCSSILK